MTRARGTKRSYYPCQCRSVAIFVYAMEARTGRSTVSASKVTEHTVILTIPDVARNKGRNSLLRSSPARERGRNQIE